ncbi:MAG: Holliday junction resolvase RuvX [Muribaculaceae bacterium]|nr:Holliday junction resolvase RuvX [Muribaculaceae bacterium]
MGRLLCIDYGRRRCGLAVTDSARIVATALDTVATASLVDRLKQYMAAEQVDAIIVGQPRDLRGRDSESMTYIRPGVERLRKAFPGTPIEFFDERFTSALAHQAMLDGGLKKSARRDKPTVDRMAATIILNDYLESRQYKSQQ